MHPLFEAEVYMRDYGDFEATKLNSKIDWYLKNLKWNGCVLVLPQDYEPDFFLGLCLVEGVNLKPDIKIINGKDLSKTLDTYHIETIITLHISE